MSGRNSTASASSASSSNSSIPDTEDDQMIAEVLAEEESSSSARKLGKRLSHLGSIPHTPRVINEIPDVNDATLDHERLSERLATYDLAELQIEGDGNCQFRALADQLFRHPDYHKHVRRQVIKQLKHFRKLYEGYVPGKYRSYLRKMKKSGEWGDHVTLQAAADRFAAKICLVPSFRDTSYIEIMPKNGNPTRELWLSFWSEVHYNSLYASGGKLWQPQLLQVLSPFLYFAGLYLITVTKLPVTVKLCPHKSAKKEALAFLGFHQPTNQHGPATRCTIITWLSNFRNGMYIRCTPHDMCIVVTKPGYGLTVASPSHQLEPGGHVHYYHLGAYETKLSSYITHEAAI